MIGSFRLPVSLTSSGDTTAPTILTATVEDVNPDKLVVVFSEVVAITNTTGLTITGAATPTLSAPTGSGSTTITFTLSTALTNGQSVTLNVASSNTIKDAANNALAATTRAITNNVAAASSYDADYQAVLDAASANGDPLPTSAQQDIDNQIMIDYKATGVYAKRGFILKAKGTAPAAFKLYCWKRKIKMVAYGSLVWDNFGVQGNGTNAYIDPLLNTTGNPLFTENDGGYEWISVDPGAQNTGAILGGYSSTSSIFISPFGGSSSVAIISGFSSYTTNYDRIGYNAVNRPNASSLDINGGTRVLGHSSKGIMEGKIVLLARSLSDNSIDLFSDAKVSWISGGLSVLTEHNAIKTVLESM